MVVKTWKACVLDCYQASRNAVGVEDEEQVQAKDQDVEESEAAEGGFGPRRYRKFVEETITCSLGFRVGKKWFCDIHGWQSYHEQVECAR